MPKFGQDLNLDNGNIKTPARYEDSTQKWIMDVEPAGSGNLIQGVVNVAAAGTRVQLPNQACREVMIIAKQGNTGSIFVGNNGVSAAEYGAELKAKDSITLPVRNLNLIYIDAAVSGEGVSFVAI